MKTNTVKPKRKPAAKQIEAARANGSKSQRPPTEAGKQKASENSFQHGIYSTKLLTTRIENSEEFKDLLRFCNAEWQPTGPTEVTLVRSLASETLLLDRWRALEAAALDSMLDRTGPGDPDLFASPPQPHAHQVAGFEKFHVCGYLPTLPVIDRTFRASLTSLPSSAAPAKT